MQISMPPISTKKKQMKRTLFLISNNIVYKLFSVGIIISVTFEQRNKVLHLLLRYKCENMPFLAIINSFLF